MRFDPGVFFPPKNDEGGVPDSAAGVTAPEELGVPACSAAMTLSPPPLPLSPPPAGLETPAGVFMRWMNADPFIFSIHDDGLELELGQHYARVSFGEHSEL